MFWDNKYKKNKYLWGKEPSELADPMIHYLKKYESDKEILNIIDIGCGYGRDVFYISQNLRCKILGIDSSKVAIKMAKNDINKVKGQQIEFRYCDFRDLKEDECDIIYFSNLYQILKKEERRDLNIKIKNILRPNGLLFLSTLSVKDPEHYGKGIPIPEELNSYQQEVYLHFCTKEELEIDFNFLKIMELYEHEYYEPRVTGEKHHHISWILIGEYK